MSNKLLHVFAQPYWHREAVLIGNKAGLLALRDAVDAALGPEGVGRSTAFCMDGEGFPLIVVRDDSKWHGDGEGYWSRASLPYTDECARGSQDDPTRFHVWNHPGVRKMLAG